MTQWISVNKCLPLNDTFVKAKMCLLPSEMELLFLNEYFIARGENVTKWVSHWMPLPESPE